MNARRVSLALLAAATSVALLTGCEPAATGASGSASASSCDPHGMPIFGGCPDGSSAPTPEAAPATQEAPAPQGSCDPHGMPILQPAGCSGGSKGQNSPAAFVPDSGVTASDIAGAATHEAGHKAVADQYGWTVNSCVIHPDGSGETDVHFPSGATPTQMAALYWAGVVAAPDTAEGAGAFSSPGDGSDMDKLLTVLHGLPNPKNGPAVSAAGHREAERIVAKHASQIRRDAAKLRATGSVS